jgi:hypothetical protein
MKCIQVISALIRYDAITSLPFGVEHISFEDGPIPFSRIVMIGYELSSLLVAPRLTAYLDVVFPYYIWVFTSKLLYFGTIENMVNDS